MLPPTPCRAVPVLLSPGPPHSAYFVYTVEFYGEKASLVLALPHLDRAVSTIGVAVKSYILLKN